MRKQSIAEQTLTRQVRSITIQEEAVIDDLAKLHAKLDTLRQIKSNLETEISRLAEIRRLASLKAKPHD